MQGSLPIAYQDEHLLVVDKPAGVLSVAGRGLWHQDHVATRLGFPVWPAHRLDLETSGLLLLGRSPEVGAQLQSQFARRQVEKVYQAVLESPPPAAEGWISLALAADPERPGQYRPHREGKSALTHYRQLQGNRLELRPQTGRSHQLRVHCRYGCASPILGDPLYGRPASRLHLHAERLTFTHPISAQRLEVVSDCPF